MYTREEILNNYKEIPFPKSIIDESSLPYQNIIFYPKSTPPLSSQNKDISSLSQSYVLPWRILQQKNNMKNVEFFRAGNFTPSEPKEPLIEIKIENFKKIYEKFGIPLDKKIIYLKKGNEMNGPYNFEELENMYKNKKLDSNCEFRTIDLFTYSEEEPFVFHPLKDINEDNWEMNYVDTPLLEYSALYSKVKELLEASKKRKNEINSLNEEITELKNQNEEKDDTINELKTKINSLEKELSEQKESANQLTQKEEIPGKEPEKEEKKEEKEEKEEDKKVENEEAPPEIEVAEKNFLYSNINTKKTKKNKKKKEKIIDNEPEEKEKEEKEEIIESEKAEIEIKPKVLDMGEEWEIAGKKKKKIEKMKEEPKVVNIPKKEEPKNTSDVNKSIESNKSKKNSNQISGEQLVELLRPKKKEIVKNEIKNDDENPNSDAKQSKGKGKKKGKKQFSDIDINLGFKY